MKRTTYLLLKVPINVRFTVPRFHEFMYLMLGETILQLVIAQPNRHASSFGSNMYYHYVVICFGFVHSISMCYSFVATEPHAPGEHALNTMKHSFAAGMLYRLYFPMKGMSVLMCGIGIKLAIHDPFKLPSSPFSLTQRLHFGAANSVCFSFVLLMAPLHRSGYTDAWHSMCRKPFLLALYGLRVALLAAMLFSAAWFEVEPWVVSVSQACQAALQCVLIRVTLAVEEEHDAVVDCASCWNAVLNYAMLSSKRTSVNAVPLAALPSDNPLELRTLLSGPARPVEPTRPIREYSEYDA